MGCNCGGAAGSTKTHVLIGPDGKETPFITKTEALAAMTATAGSRVVTRNA